MNKLRAIKCKFLRKNATFIMITIHKTQELNHPLQEAILQTHDKCKLGRFQAI